MIASAVRCHRDGDTEHAEELYRLALKSHPTRPDANHNLGVLLVHAGRLRDALPHFKAAVEAFPSERRYWLAYAQCLLDTGNANDALGVLQKARSSGLNGPQFDALREQVTARLNPGPDQTEVDLLATLLATRNFAEAELRAREMVMSWPLAGVGWKALGFVLEALHRIPEALLVLQKAQTLLPADPEISNALGTALQGIGDLSQAESVYRKAINLKPEFHEAHSNLGMVLAALGRWTEAEASYHNAIALRPDFAEAHNNLGGVYWALGRSAEAEMSYRCAIEINPELSSAQSNLLFCLSHNERVDSKVLAAEHARFGNRIENDFRVSWPRHSNIRNPDRILQVGFVSGDFCEHPVAHLIEPVLEQFGGNARFSLHAYSSNHREDDVTSRLRRHFNHWRRIGGCSDPALAETIQADGIDILIDLSGHTSRHRLPVFARKPAPVQASWIGYPGTTGLSAMDYYLADPFFLPHEQFQQQFTEKIVHLPAVVAFRPAQGAPAINELPALGNRYVTFGSFNRQDKIDLSAIELWSKLLKRLPDSRMILGGLPQGGRHESLAESFAQHGIARERLSFHARSGMGDYLALHGQVDFCLDTLAYSGGTTTLHALWMGVPTLTVAGDTPPRRQGAAIMTHMGLEDFIAKNAEDFVKKGQHWAGRPQELAKLRQGMRDRFAKSVIGQPALVATGLASALRVMWQRWCKGHAPESFSVK